MKTTREYDKHRSDSIQGTEYIAAQIEGFLGQKLKIYNEKSGETSRNLWKICNIADQKT